MVAKKRASKRQTLQTKYKIIKRTKQHHKKLKRGLLKPSSKKRTVDNSIPNAWPFKEQLLLDIQAAKARKEAAIEEQKQKRAEEIVSTAS